MGIWYGLEAQPLALSGGTQAWLTKLGAGIQVLAARVERMPYTKPRTWKLTLLFKTTTDRDMALPLLHNPDHGFLEVVKKDCPQSLEAFDQRYDLNYISHLYATLRNEDNVQALLDAAPLPIHRPPSFKGGDVTIQSQWHPLNIDSILDYARYPPLKSTTYRRKQKFPVARFTMTWFTMWLDSTPSPISIEMRRLELMMLAVCDPVGIFYNTARYLSGELFPTTGPYDKILRSISLAAANDGLVQWETRNAEYFGYEKNGLWVLVVAGSEPGLWFPFLARFEF